MHTKLEYKAWALVYAGEAWVEQCLNSYPLRRGSESGAGVMQAQAVANTHFPVSKSQLCSVLCPSSRGFPSALLVNTTWPRIHCGGATSADWGDCLLLRVCLLMEVRELWAFVCGSSWGVYVFSVIHVQLQQQNNYADKSIFFPFYFFMTVSLLFSLSVGINSVSCSYLRSPSFTLLFPWLDIPLRALSSWPIVHH